MNYQQLTRYHGDLVSDRLALIAFKDSISSYSKTILSNWTFTDGEDDSAICSWIGVTCNDTMVGLRVVGLTLKRASLHGTLSPSISNLSALLTLDLSENEIHGMIPHSLSDLRTLKFLSLEKNLLQHRVPDLCRLPSLTYMSLSGNQLSGDISETLLRNCTHLCYLDLSTNQFSGALAPDFGNELPALHTLYLYNNFLHGEIPSSLRNCTFLTDLDIENNSFSGELPTDLFCERKSLNYLHLSYNNFRSGNDNTDLTPFFYGLRKCVVLKELQLYGIGLGGELPEDIGFLLSLSLYDLEIQHNHIRGSIPRTLSILNLTLLNLSNNLLDGTIPQEIGRMKYLERLLLSNNSFNGTIPATIGMLSHLGSLDLSRNRLQGQIPPTLSNLTQLRGLFLHGNQLSGSIPVSLCKCENLETLDLSFNKLSGRIPAEIRGLKELSIYFNLSYNLLTGTIPVEISEMDKVQEIDLSSNNLSGTIISQISNCVGAQSINLSHNSLTGQIPKSIGTMQNLISLDLSVNFLSNDIPKSLENCKSLKLLNLSYNNLSGMVPISGIVASLNISLSHNPQLCGSISELPSCQERKRSRAFLHNTKILALVLATTVSATFFVLTICCFICFNMIKKALRLARSKIERGYTQSPLHSKYPRISYADIVEATDSFDPDKLLGTGSYGEVYKGELKDGREVAIKVLKLQSGNSSKSFHRECQVLKSIRHRNLMRIITACSQPDFKAIVLPFMAKGSLESHLYPDSDLSLIERVNICSDVAEGMAYLHHHSPVKVIHCDLKPSNILLNDDMTALVSDFGIARLLMNFSQGTDTTTDETTQDSTTAILLGSIGYIPPEYGMGRGASTKGDVYSFGVLVLEMVTRKKPTHEMFANGGLNLHEWVKRHHYHGQVEDIIDPVLSRIDIGDAHHHDRRHDSQHHRKMWECAIVELVELGLFCTQQSAAARPTMMDAADDLERLKRYLAGETSITFASSLGISSSSTTFARDDGQCSEGQHF